MKLNQILTSALLSSAGCAPVFRDAEILSVETDSRRAKEGSLFFCIPGAVTDGHLYAKSAYDNGCRHFVCERALGLPSDAVQITVPDSRAALSSAAAEFYGRPADRLHLIGITGTKGKSTVASFVYDVLRGSGKKAGIIGTLGAFWNEKKEVTVNTTPDCLVLQRLFAQMLGDGIEYVVLEVSSQSFLTRRVEGMTFDVGVFTNLSRDHIGFPEHPDMENYAWCKSRLFSQSRVSVINADDPRHTQMEDAAAENGGKVLRYGLGTDSDIMGDDPVRLCENGLGVGFTCENIRFRLPMPGLFNVYNALAAAAACREAAGIPLRESAEILASSRVSGRFETVPAPEDRTFIIDYAHNGLSLRSVLEEIRAYSPKKLTVLVGSVGGRTKERRAELGAVAGELADAIIFTADNPDREDPRSICEEMAAHAGKTPFVIIPDRTEAVAYAVRGSIPGEAVLFAGKGHEDYQLIDGVKEPYSDRSAVAEAMKAAGTGAKR